jgi:hypothetical protein
MVPKGTFAFVLTRIEFFHDSLKCAFLINRIATILIKKIVAAKGYLGGKKNKIAPKKKKSIKPRIAQNIRGTIIL